MSQKIVLTLELSDNINVNTIVDGFNEVIGDSLEYVKYWELMYK